MNTIKWKIAFLYLLLFPLCGYSQTLRMVAGESPPLQSEFMATQGQFTAVSRAIFERAGYQIDVTFLPFKKGKTEARKGTFDGIIGDYWSKDRAHNFYFTNAIYRTEKILVQNKGRGISYTRMDQLKRFQIGSLAGVAYTEDLRGFGIDTLAVESDLTSLKMLSDEQIDLALMGKPQFRYLIDRPELIKVKAELEILDRSFKFYDLFCSITKNRSDGEQIIERFNKAMKEMKQDGSYQKVMHKHGLRKRPD